MLQSRQKRFPVGERIRAFLAIADDAILKFVSFLTFRAYASTGALFTLCCLLYLPGISSFPVTDRDEGRFTQSSKQMLETGDYIDIRLQDAPRYKKPIGIYWLQAASAGAAHRFGAALNSIWAYRIPSFLGAAGAVLLLFWSARGIFGRQVALLSAALFACCVTLTFEAHIAKSDAALICSLVLMQGALFRLYMSRSDRGTKGLATLFWLGLGAGVLLKGPIALALALSTILAVTLVFKRRRWLRNLHWRSGIPLFLAVTLPWFIAIGFSSGGLFFRNALGNDFAAKLQSGQESHWGPPGYYLLLFWFTFWPATHFVTLSAIGSCWRRRITVRGAFLISWIVPFWVLVEAVPTKLPHYALPLYPAIALATVWAANPLGGSFANASRRQSCGIVYGSIAVALLVLLCSGLWLFEADFSLLLAVLLAAYAIAVGTALAATLQGYRNLELAAIVASALTFYAAAFQSGIPALHPVWISERATEAANALRACGSEPPIFSGYAEPSAVFLNGTKTALADPSSAAELLSDGKPRVAFVEWRSRLGFEQKFLENVGRQPAFLGCVDGLNINGRGPTRLHIYVHPETVKRPGCSPLQALRCQSKPDVRWRRMLDSKF